MEGLINIGIILTYIMIGFAALTAVSFGVKNVTDLKNIISLGGGVHSSSESIISWGRTFFVNLKTTI